MLMVKRVIERLRSTFTANVDVINHHVTPSANTQDGTQDGGSRETEVDDDCDLCDPEVDPIL